jgi:hypothetical protein
MLQLMGECSGTEINVKQHVVTEVFRKVLFLNTKEKSILIYIRLIL